MKTKWQHQPHRAVRAFEHRSTPKSPPVRSIVAGNPITRPRKRARTTGAITEQIWLLVGAEESDPDAEEAAQQDEVGEVREVHDVRAGPADQDQLDEQHQERRQEELETVARHGQEP